MKPAIACAVIACCACSCDRRAPITSCRQDLTGPYVADGKQWMVLDRGSALEVYPLFFDIPTVTGLEIAPRVIDLEREGDALVGHVRRRYMRGMASCTAKLPVRVTACTDDTLDVVLADPVPPLAFEPCRFPLAEGNRRERWRVDRR